MVRSHAIYPVDLRAHPEKGREPCQTSPTLASGFSIQPKNPSIPQKQPRFARQAKRFALVILQQAFLLVDEV